MLTAEILREHLHYDPETGIFRWRKKSIKRELGDIAGRHVHGYIKIGLLRKEYQAHRLAWLYVYGEHPKNIIDHFNGIKTDNRICNLRDVSHRGNNQNLSYHREGKLLGANFHKERNAWRSRIRVDGKDIHLGYFPTKEEAHQAYIQYVTENNIL